MTGVLTIGMTMCSRCQCADGPEDSTVDSRLAADALAAGPIAARDSRFPIPDFDVSANDDAWIVATSDGPGFRTDITGGGFTFIADEPVGVGGSGAGPTPYEYMIAAAGSCTAMTVRMYANRKQWPLERVVVRMRDTPAHIKDCLECETSDVGPRGLDRSIELIGPLTDEQRKRILQIADRCPVKQTLERGIQIRTVE